MKKSKIPTYSIQSFYFENFKGIKKLAIKNLPENAPWIFLTGENGFGKTYILQAIATCFASRNEISFLELNARFDARNSCEIHGEGRFNSKHLYKQKSKGGIVISEPSFLLFHPLL